MQLQDEVLVSDTERLSTTHSNVKKVYNYTATFSFIFPGFFVLHHKDSIVAAKTFPS
jgi:hypothetical protein